MEPEDVLESLAYGLPFFAIAGVFFAIASWKKIKGRGLHARAQALLSSGNQKEARDVLLEALWKANEESSLERRILADLRGLYQEAGIQFSTDDYELLIRQFEGLSKKGSTKALGELKQVQALKRELIGRMPSID